MNNAQMLETIEKRVELLKAENQVQEILKTMSEEEGKKFLIDTAISTLLGI